MLAAGPSAPLEPVYVCFTQSPRVRLPVTVIASPFVTGSGAALTLTRAASDSDAAGNGDVLLALEVAVRSDVHPRDRVGRVAFVRRQQRAYRAANTSAPGASPPHPSNRQPGEPSRSEH